MYLYVQLGAHYSFVLGPVFDIGTTGHLNSTIIDKGSYFGRHLKNLDLLLRMLVKNKIKQFIQGKAKLKAWHFLPVETDMTNP